MTGANERKPKYTGEFEIWGTDACRNYDYCGGRITLFVANKKCISCDPESYKKREVLPDDSAKDEDFEKVQAEIESWKSRFENADAFEKAYANECGVLRGELDYHKNQLAKAQAEIEEQCRINGIGAQRELKLMSQVELLKSALLRVSGKGTAIAAEALEQLENMRGGK